MNSLTTAFVALLWFFWVLCFVSHIGGAMINILLIVAIVIILFNLFNRNGSYPNWRK